MAVLNNSNAISPSGYDINNSVRLRRSATAYLSRTPSSTTNRQTWTWSGWVKRGVIGVRQHIFVSANPVVNTGGQQELQFAFDSSDRIEITGGTSGVGQDLNLTTTQVFRDPSAWYHLVILMDTTQATSSNRIKFYVNGVQVTTFTTAIYPAQNHNTAVNLTGFSHRIGGSGGSYLDAYQAEINFIDGQALTPSSFGETDTTTGSWKPKAYTGTYGTNGFYLKFSDIATTSGSNAGLGKDFSGNTNYWTTNNISVTAGVTYDAMIDSPTLTSATVANYAVLNPLSKGTNASITNANLSVSYGAAAWTSAFGTMGVSTGKWYWEITLTSAGTDVGVGISTNPAGSANSYIGSDINSWGYYGSNGNKWNNNSQTAYGATYANGDVIGVALDLDAGTLVFYKNNTSQGTAFSSLASNTYFPALSVNNSSFAANFGQRPFAYTPPTGFNRLNTFNLPDSTIKKGNTVMDATLYTGDGASSRTITGVNFQPDFSWIKVRSTTYNHREWDAVRGAGNAKGLYTNLTNAEGGGGQDDNGYLSAFNSDGFSLASGSSGIIGVNQNAETYVAWLWKAGGSTSSNTSGSITSTVSVNATAGFSIVTYTGTGANATVGHGLGVAPKMIIVKNRTTTDGWTVYNSNLTSASYVLNLHNTNAQTLSATNFNGTAPTSTVFSVGTNTNTNGSTNSLVAYCWAEISGFSKFSSYVGNGSTDGPFVYTGFRPKYVMVKCSSSSHSGDASWYIYDSSRNTSNVVNFILYSDGAAAEITATTVDLLSNGFKIRASGVGNNGSGSTYIFMAFAEVPTKFANAR